AVCAGEMPAGGAGRGPARWARPADAAGVGPPGGDDGGPTVAVAVGDVDRVVAVAQVDEQGGAALGPVDYHDVVPAAGHDVVPAGDAREHDRGGPAVDRRRRVGREDRHLAPGGDLDPEGVRCV